MATTESPRGDGPLPPDDAVEVLRAQGITNGLDPWIRALTRLLAAGDARWRRLCVGVPAGAHGEGRVSPRLLVLLARALATRHRDTVRLEGKPLAALACLLMRLDPEHRPRRVELVTDQPALARRTVDRVMGEAHADIAVIGRDTGGDAATGPGAGASRKLVLRRGGEPAAARPAGTVVDGIAITVSLDRPLPSIHQVIRHNGITARVDLSRHVPRFGAGTPSTGEATVPLRRLLAAELHQESVWAGRTEGRLEQLVKASVDQLFSGGPVAGDDARSRTARALFHLGYLEQLTASKSGAASLYRASLEARESAEAWTFIGWLHAQQARIEPAMEACKKAIGTDPTLGNPYNDIGAYLFTLRQNDAAKTWFHRALRAPRYVAPHYPLTNLARIHLQEGDLQAAREAARNALDSRGDYAPARRLMQQIEAHGDPLGR